MVKCELPKSHVPLPHVFPPSAIRQSPTGRATLGSRTLSDVASLCHSLRWCKKITAHPQLRTLVWCDAIDGSAVAIRSSVPYGAPFLVAAAPRVPSSNK